MSSAIISFIVIGVIIFVIKMAVSAPAISEANRVVEKTKSVVTVIEKSQHLMALFKNSVDNSKLNIENKKYFSYYICYLDACIKSVSEYDGVPYDITMRTGVFIEAFKLKNNPPESHEFTEEDLNEGEELLNSEKLTEFGVLGEQEGKLDGDYSNNPSNPAPYFQHLISYFK